MEGRPRAALTSKVTRTRGRSPCVAFAVAESQSLGLLT